MWQDSQDKRSGRSVRCFVRKWKEKVAWPRLTKEDNKVRSDSAFSVCPRSQVSSGATWLPCPLTFSLSLSYLLNILNVFVVSLLITPVQSLGEVCCVFSASLPTHGSRLCFLHGLRHIFKP